MNYTVKRFNPENWKDLEKALRNKANHLRSEGLAHLPPIFDIGDEVGFFYGSSPDDHTVGIIVDENELHVTIRSIDGQTHKISPFLLFALK